MAPFVAAATFIGSMGNNPLATVLNANEVLFAGPLHFSFAALGITPESGRAVEDVVQFALDYTFWLNLLMVFVAAGMVALHFGHIRGRSGLGAGVIPDALRENPTPVPDRISPGQPLGFPSPYEPAFLWRKARISF